ncbi:hypothetical protein SAMN05216420_10934 [Nitrosospira sp. Nl5]|nr:hypothetical protein SAMN05216420_10934 [Nitrosospira sp. Nl5]
MDLPPQIKERIVRSIQAAIKYEVSANIFLAVAEKEGGKPEQWVRNSNDTYDIGPMQFNTTYLGASARIFAKTKATYGRGYPITTHTCPISTLHTGWI